MKHYFSFYSIIIDEETQTNKVELVTQYFCILYGDWHGIIHRFVCSKLINKTPSFFFQRLGDYTIPAGCSINILIFALHRNPAIYSDPLVFDPERFLDVNMRRNPYAYVPFSAGPRNCIGITSSLFLISIFLSIVIYNCIYIFNYSIYMRIVLYIIFILWVYNIILYYVKLL